MEKPFEDLKFHGYTASAEEDHVIQARVLRFFDATSDSDGDVCSKFGLIYPTESVCYSAPTRKRTCLFHVIVQTLMFTSMSVFQQSDANSVCQGPLLFYDYMHWRC